VAAAPSAALAGSFVVFAAASLKESLDDVAAAWRSAGRGERGREPQDFASARSFCSSPDWYISFMMSQPPTNSPFT
jgi:hypothetical protein